MLRDVSRYKLALLLAAIFAVAQIAFVVHVAMTAQQIAVSVLSFIGVVIVLGLWLCSPFVRYAGAVYLVLWSAMILWSSFATGVVWTGAPIIISAYWIVLLATGLSLAVLLVLSKKFAAEFAEQRRIEPRHKTIFRRMFHWVFGLAAVALTLLDIMQLAT